MDDALVGRGPELVVLGDFLTRSAADGGALFLTGEPGVGKTGSLHPVTTAIASRFHCGRLDSNRKQNTTRLSRRSAPRRR